MAWFSKGLVYTMQLYKLAEGIACFDKALEIDPNNQQVKDTKARLLELIKEKGLSL